MSRCSQFIIIEICSRWLSLYEVSWPGRSLSGRSGVVLCDVVFPSKQAGKVDGFLDRHQIGVVSAVEPNSAGAKFPVVMSFVTPLVEYFHSLITTNCSKREE